MGDPVNERSKFYLIRRGTVEVFRPTTAGRCRSSRNSGPAATSARWRC